MKKKLKDYIPYILTGISFVGSVASIYSVYKDELYIAFVIMFCLSSVLIISFLVHVPKYNKYKTYYSIRGDLSNFSNKIRTYFEIYTSSESLNEFEIGVNEATNTILNTTSSAMTKLVGRKCTVSIMLPCDDEKHFETVAYCNNVEHDRENFSSKPLDGEKGVIGNCIKTGRVQFWCNNSNRNDFEKIRDDYMEFYQSGVSCPVFVNGKVAAILNIDTKEESSFEDHIKDIAVIFSNALASVYEVSDFEYSKGAK
jgi:hypothetical protein